MKFLALSIGAPVVQAAVQHYNYNQQIFGGGSSQTDLILAILSAIFGLLAVLGAIFLAIELNKQKTPEEYLFEGSTENDHELSLKLGCDPTEDSFILVPCGGKTGIIQNHWKSEISGTNANGIALQVPVEGGGAIFYSMDLSGGTGETDNLYTLPNGVDGQIVFVRATGEVGSKWTISGKIKGGITYGGEQEYGLVAAGDIGILQACLAVVWAEGYWNVVADSNDTLSDPQELYTAGTA